jgi:hypothetical protein
MCFRPQRNATCRPVRGYENNFTALGVGHWDSRTLRAAEMVEKTKLVCNTPQCVLAALSPSLLASCVPFACARSGTFMVLYWPLREVMVHEDVDELPDR